MNHHDKDFKEDTNKAGKSDVIKGEDKIDFGKDVKQAVTELPNPAKDATVEIPEKELEGKKSNKGAAEIKKYAEVFGCGFCAVSIAKGGLGAVVTVPNKKFKKGKDGKYNLRSPGADGGGVVAVLCEAHAREAERLPEGVIDIKTAVAISPEGPRNVAVREL